MRIVCLVPSLSELLAHLGLGSYLVGVTAFCVHPPHLAKQAQVVGGTKDPDLTLIKQLKPSHIVVNREENTPEVIAGCRELALVYETAPVDPHEVPAMVLGLGDFLGAAPAAQTLATAIDAAVARLQAVRQSSPKAQVLTGKRYLYYIWTKPWMVAASPTYIEGLLKLLGLVNAAPSGGRYPVLSCEDAQACAADYLFFSSEPWPFRRRDYERLQREWPSAPPVFWIDGRLLSWYGVSTLHALEVMIDLLAAPGERADMASKALIRSFEESLGFPP